MMVWGVKISDVVRVWMHVWCRCECCRCKRVGSMVRSKRGKNRTGEGLGSLAFIGVGTRALGAGQSA